MTATPRLAGVVHAAIPGGPIAMLGLALCIGGIAAAQPAPPPPAMTATMDEQAAKARLEAEKLQLEVSNLRRGPVELRDVLPIASGLVLGVLSTVGALWLAHRARLGTLDQAVHEQRLEMYPQLVKAGAPLALFFPANTDPLRPCDCRAMGRAMSDWYFAGGLLLSTQSRDAYFRVIRALTLAAAADRLQAPRFPEDAPHISVEKIRTYHRQLAGLNLNDIENWRFGPAGSSDTGPAFRFKDYVFLQHLVSLLRTELSNDLRSRRRANAPT